jgi:MFS family permease
LAQFFPGKSIDGFLAVCRGLRVYLASQHWTSVAIGFVLTVAGLAGLVSQVPSGELLDVVAAKRPLVALGLVMVAAAATIFALVPSFALVLAAEVLQGTSGACVQVLDGISEAVVGVLTPLVIADITKGTGRFNLAQGIVGTFSGIGASLSTTASGFVAQSFGSWAGFLP